MTDKLLIPPRPAHPSIQYAWYYGKQAAYSLIHRWMFEREMVGLRIESNFTGWCDG